MAPGDFGGRRGIDDHALRRAAGIQRRQQHRIVAQVAMRRQAFAQTAIGEPLRIGLLAARMGRADQAQRRGRRRIQQFQEGAADHAGPQQNHRNIGRRDM
jgi:hypothetical protein